VTSIASKIVAKDNYMNTYKSPTDMWISSAGFCFANDEIVSVASLQEIRRRKVRYKEMVDRKEWEKIWLDKCDQLESKCLDYIQAKGYNKDLKLE
jgi:uncharacterized protein (UPF0371 family)